MVEERQLERLKDRYTQRVFEMGEVGLKGWKKKSIDVGVVRQRYACLKILARALGSFPGAKGCLRGRAAAGGGLANTWSSNNKVLLREAIGVSQKPAKCPRGPTAPLGFFQFPVSDCGWLDLSVSRYCTLYLTV